MKLYFIQLSLTVFALIEVIIKTFLLNGSLTENAGGSVFFGYIYIYLLLYVIIIFYILIIVIQCVINYLKIRLIKPQKSDWILLISLTIVFTLITIFYKSEFDIESLVLISLFLPVYSMVISAIFTQENKFITNK
jgi:hypothetical protein